LVEIYGASLNCDCWFTSKKKKEYNTNNIIYKYENLSFLTHTHTPAFLRNVGAIGTGFWGPTVTGGRIIGPTVPPVEDAVPDVGDNAFIPWGVEDVSITVGKLSICLTFGPDAPFNICI
jgi:hypothetical protein